MCCRQYVSVNPRGTKKLKNLKIKTVPSSVSAKLFSKAKGQRKERVEFKWVILTQQ